MLAVHHIHQDVEDDLHADNGGYLWALTGAGSTASTIVIENSGTYDRQSGDMIDWPEMEGWTSVGDVTAARNEDTDKAGQPREDGTTKKQAGKRPTTGGRTRATKTPTSKMQEYKKMLMVDTSDEDEDSVGPEGPPRDENNDPSITVLHSRVTIPNVLPVPAFISPPSWRLVLQMQRSSAWRLSQPSEIGQDRRAKTQGTR